MGTQVFRSNVDCINYRVDILLDMIGDTQCTTYCFCSQNTVELGAMTDIILHRKTTNNIRVLYGGSHGVRRMKYFYMILSLPCS